MIHLVIEVAIKDMRDQIEAISQMDMTLEARINALLMVYPHCFGKINDWVYDDLKRYCPEEWERMGAFAKEGLSVLSKILTMGIAQGELRAMNTTVAVQSINGAIKAMLDYHFLSENNLTYNDALRVFTDMLFYGIIQRNPSSGMQEPLRQ